MAKPNQPRSAWRVHDWLAPASWLLFLSCVTRSVVPRLASVPLQVYIVEPLLWLSIGASAGRSWWRNRQVVLPVDRQLLTAAAVAATLQVALAVVGGAVDGFRASPHPGGVGLLLLDGWRMAAQLVGLELVRWLLIVALRPRGAGLAVAAGTLVIWLAQSGPWLLSRLGSGLQAMPLAGHDLLPAATASLLASYLALVGGPLPSLAYRGALAVFEWLSPILPNLHWPMATLLAIGNPFVGWLIVSDRVEQDRLNRKLEEGIAGRTAELSHANALLEAQMAERLRAEEELRRCNRELATLNAVAATVGSSLELSHLVRSLEQLLAVELGIRAGALYSYEREEDRLALRAAWGLPAEVEEEARCLPIAALESAWGGGAFSPFFASTVGEGKGAAGGAPLLEAVLEQSAGAAAKEAGAAPASPATLQTVQSMKENCSPCLYLPLQTNSELRGAVCLFGLAPAGLSGSDVAFFSALAGQIGVAMHNADLYSEVRTGRERLQALSRRLVEAQEAERRHIARELHDEAGQALALLKLGLGLLERHAGGPEASRRRVAELKEIADGVSESLHRLATDLRPASLDLGLVPALRQYAGALSSRHGLSVQVETVGLEATRLVPEVESAVFRIVQEAVANTIRHARATRVGVLLERRDGHLLATVEDDGMGFDVRQTTAGGRLGLVGMQERAEMLGGTLMIETAPGAGTTVIVEVPYGCADPGG